MFKKMPGFESINNSSTIEPFPDSCLLVSYIYTTKHSFAIKSFAGNEIQTSYNLELNDRTFFTITIMLDPIFMIDDSITIVSR